MAEPIILNSFFSKRRDISTWKKKDALQVKRMLNPFVGKKVVLYGGGGSGSDLVKLLSVKIVKPTYYDKENKPYTPKQDIYQVDVELRAINGEIFGKKTFKPHIGSWKLAKLK